MKMNFPGKKGLCQFLNIPIIYHRLKNQKKTMAMFDSSNSPSLPLIAGIELIPESLSIFNPGLFFTLLSFLKAVWGHAEVRADLKFFFFF